MIAEKLISRLSGVQGRSPRWRAICPAHETKNRSRTLAVKEAEDGRVLLHCFAGCDVHQIVEAVGLELHDLFPPKTDDDKRGRRVRFDANDALYLIDREVQAAALLIAACSGAAGLVPESVANRLAEAAGRISSARAACLPTR
jgi:hypothetical protein